MQKYLQLPISIELLLDISKAIAKLDIAPTRIDLATLATQYLNEKANNADTFVAEKLKDYGKEKELLNQSM